MTGVHDAALIAIAKTISRGKAVAGISRAAGRMKKHGPELGRGTGKPCSGPMRAQRGMRDGFPKENCNAGIIVIKIPINKYATSLIGSKSNSFAFRISLSAFLKEK